MKCMRGGSKAQIRNDSDGQIYDLSAFDEKVKALVGKRVVLTGEMDPETHVITVANARAAERKLGWSAKSRAFRSLESRCAIDRSLERAGDRVIRGGIRPRPPCRRHRLRPKLGDDALPDLGLSSRIGDVDAFEHKAGGTESLVVTGDAVLVEDFTDARPLDSRSRSLRAGAEV